MNILTHVSLNVGQVFSDLSTQKGHSNEYILYVHSGSVPTIENRKLIRSEYLLSVCIAGLSLSK